VVVDILVLVRVALAVFVDAVVERLLYLGSLEVEALELPAVTRLALEYPYECLLSILPYR
jgi:hypothetical protein